jgi:hypothetical protein
MKEHLSGTISVESFTGNNMTNTRYFVVKEMFYEGFRTWIFDAKIEKLFELQADWLPEKIEATEKGSIVLFVP